MTELVKTVASGWFIYLPHEDYPDSGMWLNLAQVQIVHKSDERLIVKLIGDKTLHLRDESVEILSAELTRLSRQSPLV